MKNTGGNGYLAKSSKQIIDEASTIIDFESLLKEQDLENVADRIITASYGEFDIMRKDSVDRFLDFVYFKVQTGYWDNFNEAFPSRRMIDGVLEEKVREIMNVHLYPDIVLKLLKFFTRNLHDADTNLYLANLIHSEEIIRAIYETFLLFKKDIFISDPDKRALNVKRIQQFSPRSDSKLSSPLDAAARFKYVLEFLSLKNRIDHIYRREDLALSINL